MIGVQIPSLKRNLVPHYVSTLAEEGLDFQVKFNRDGQTAHLFITDNNETGERSLQIRRAKMELRLYKSLLSAGTIDAECYDILKASSGQLLWKHQKPALEAFYDSLGVKTACRINIKDLPHVQPSLSKLSFRSSTQTTIGNPDLGAYSYSSSENPREVYREFEDFFGVFIEERQRVLARLFEGRLCFQCHVKGVTAFLHDNFLGLPHVKTIDMVLRFRAGRIRGGEPFQSTWIDDWRQCHYALRHNLSGLTTLKIHISNFFDPDIKHPAPWTKGPDAVLDTLHVGCETPSLGIEEFNNFFTCLFKYPPRVRVQFLLVGSSTTLEESFKAYLNEVFRARQMAAASWHPDSANPNPVCQCKSQNVAYVEECCLLNGWWKRKPV